MDSADLLDLLGNENRRRILALLARRPYYVTEMSEELLEERVRNPPTLREVLLAKADYADRILRLAGYDAPRTT